MARTQFTFTFRNAEPGAAVTFSAAVYSSPVDAVADGPTLALDATRTVAVWSDASELSATWVDGSGASVTAEASVARPVVVETGGVTGASPAPSGGSGTGAWHLLGTVTHATTDDTECAYSPPVGATILAVAAVVRTRFDVNMLVQSTGDDSSGVAISPSADGIFAGISVSNISTADSWLALGSVADPMPLSVTDASPLVFTSAGNPNATGDADVYLYVIDAPF